MAAQIRRRYFAVLRNTIFSALALLFVIVAGGVAYTWYMGQHSSQTDQVVATQPNTTTIPVVSPSKRAANAPESVSIQSMDSPVIAGSNSTLTARTAPASQCQITVKYNKVASNDSGLISKIADEFGIVSWTWTVSSNTPIGSWPVDVMCSENKKSAVVSGLLQVTH
jgi:hypothetical protein